MKTILLLIGLILIHIQLHADAVRRLGIIHTNDLHAYLMPASRQAGFARIAAFIKETRKNRDRVLVLDAGDMITGTPVSSIYQGEPVFSIAAKMGYDAGTFGNHEFDHGWEQALKLRDLAGFPLICANILMPDGSCLASCPWKIFELDGIRVGVFGLTTEKLRKYVATDRMGDCRVLPELQTAKEMAALLREKSDVVVALTHIGLDEDKKLAAAVPDIDLIIGGHSHSQLKEPILVNRTWIAQTGCHGHYVGLINIEVGKERPYKLDGSLIPPYKLPPPDPEVAALVKHWEDQVSSKVDINIGEAREKLSQAQLKKLIEEAIRARSSADLGYYNQGGIRASLNKGPVSARDIWNIEPFGNNIVIATLRGDKIGGALLRSLRESKFPIKADKLYRVATNNYVTGDPGRFIGKPENSVDTGISVRDTIIEHIRKHGTDTNKL